MTEPDDFERRAAERVVELGNNDRPIDLGTFAAMFDLFRVSARVVGDLESEVHRPLGLSIAGFRVLFTVWVFDSLEVREIARLSGVSRAAVSGVVTTLEREGLACRNRDHDDGRLVSVTATPAGVEMLRMAYQAQNVREGDLFAALSPAELDRFTGLLRKILNADAPEDSRSADH
jgi:DNA-binding MarR family transcriptional regulator